MAKEWNVLLHVVQVIGDEADSAEEAEKLARHRLDLSGFDVYDPSPGTPCAEAETVQEVD